MVKAVKTMEFFLKLPPHTYDDYDLSRIVFEIEEYGDFFDKYSPFIIKSAI